VSAVDTIEWWPVMRSTGFDEHPNDDPEKRARARARSDSSIVEIFVVGLTLGPERRAAVTA
jgi:hypothetical protein